MALLSIQERSGGSESSNAAVRFDNGPLYPITINTPFSDKEEDELEWYFEEHLEFPFTNKVRAQNAAKSITTYGEKLFKQVFGDPDIYAEYRAQLKDGLSSLHIEIEGPPPFHALHWEAIKDPKLAQPLALQATMVHKNLRPQVLPASVRTSPTINLLIVTARPSGERDVGYRTISRPLVESLRNANLPVQIDILRPGTYKALENHLRMTTEQHGEGYYHVIHFDVHGAVLTYGQYERSQRQTLGNSHLYKQYARDPIQSYEGVKAFLSFESDTDDGDKKKQLDLVEATQLATLLVKHHVPITILNACQSGKQVGERETSLGSHLVQAGVQLVLAMGYSVTVSAAELLMTTLYQRLFAGDDLTVAIRHARTELANDKERLAYFDQKIVLEDWLLPVVYQNRSVTLQPREFTPDERSAWFERKAEEKRYTPPDPTYGFVGRDLDILHIEKRLLTRRNILLVRGMGGAGKTTLLSHLAAWWHTTGFVRRVFSFCYDYKAWTLQQMMADIAQTLYGPRYYTDFQPLSPEAQQAMLAGRLRSENHLLLLDNLESITGAHLAIQHTLPQTEQKALHSFLADLAKGHTLVLLGSRSSEDWLSKGTFDDNIYELSGLDKEAASLLVDRILERQHAIHYREQPELRHLLKLLNGFPLALEVVLSNLAHQTPAEVLAALQAGDERLDIEDSQLQEKNIFEQKTDSILHCIDYSHSNLSPDSQKLLLCLAPFTSVIGMEKSILNNYIKQLCQQPALSTLPFDRWSEVLREAQNWGLLSPDLDNARFLRLQPIFPYFLRNRLHEPEYAEVKSAIETAFRQHYEVVGKALRNLLESKEAQERHIGQLLMGFEYENLVMAIKLALEAQVSILDPYRALTSYLDAMQDQPRGLELGQSVLALLESYPAHMLSGQLVSEIVGVVDNIAKRQLKLKRYKEAEDSYKRALSIHLQLKFFDEKTSKVMSANIYHHLGGLAGKQRQWNKATQYYQKSLDIQLECNDLEGQALTYQNLGVVAIELRQFDKAEQYCQQTLKICNDIHENYVQAATYLPLGVIARERHQWLQAEGYFQQALQIYLEYSDHYGQASAYYNLGSVAKEQHQWDKAKRYYQQAFQVYLACNDRDGQADIFYKLGIIAREENELPQAEQYFQQALQFYIEYGDRHSRASTFHQLGILAQEQQEWSQAQDYFQQALQIHHEFNDQYSQADTYSLLGGAAAEQRQWHQAERYFQQALQIYNEFNAHDQQAGTCHILGVVAQEQHQWTQARDYYLTALMIYMASNDTHNGSVAMGNLIRLWQASGDADLLATIASIFGTTVVETEARLRQALGEK